MVFMDTGPQGWYGMTKLLDAGYVSQAGELFWLTLKGLRLLDLLDNDEPEPSISPARKHVRVSMYIYFAGIQVGDFQPNL